MRWRAVWPPDDWGDPLRSRGSCANHRAGATPATVLTSREHEVLELLARGWTNREIAQQLIIGTRTVKVHVEHILARLGVSDRTQAAVQALQLGYLTSQPPRHRIPCAVADGAPCA
jgi:DNA-binding NarL/FixJ family response regulator